MLRFLLNCFLSSLSCPCLSLLTLLAWNTARALSDALPPTIHPLPNLRPLPPPPPCARAAPHVLVWSAVACSSAFPFLYAPQQPLARDARGYVVGFAAQVGSACVGGVRGVWGVWLGRRRVRLQRGLRRGL